MTFPKITIGLDVGDRYSQIFAVDDEGEVIEEGRLPTTQAALQHRFSGMERVRIVLEVGTHSPWMSRLLTELGHEVLVANPRALHRRREDKNDAIDAESLARWGRSDPRMLRPVQHRGEETQIALAYVRARDRMVATRTKLINHVRGAVKSLGSRIPKCSAEVFHTRAITHIPSGLKPALKPVLQTIAGLTKTLRQYERTLLRQCKERYPDTARLTQVRGVGVVTALTFVLVLEDPHRFRSSRSTGAFVGLKPRQHDSGQSQPQLAISKRGDELLRKLLVQCGQYLPGPLGPDCDLRRWGLRLAERGGKRRSEEAGGRGRGAQAGGAAARVVDQWCRVRAPAAQYGSGRLIRSTLPGTSTP